jgi:hypothetical protein
MIGREEFRFKISQKREQYRFKKKILVVKQSSISLGGPVLPVGRPTAAKKVDG